MFKSKSLSVYFNVTVTHTFTFVSIFWYWSILRNIDIFLVKKTKGGLGRVYCPLIRWSNTAAARLWLLSPRVMSQVYFLAKGMSFSYENWWCVIFNSILYIKWELLSTLYNTFNLVYYAWKWVRVFYINWFGGLHQHTGYIAPKLHLKV